MNRDLYSNMDFTKMKEELNKEIKRRGTYKWFDPLTTPSVGEDRNAPLSLPEDEGDRIQISEKTYTINNPSEGSIESTKNVYYPAHGENPSGQSTDINSGPNTSAAQFNVDEMKNFLVGLSKIQDINLFYGRDEIDGLAFRDPQGIKDAIISAQNSELNKPLMESDISPTKNDPNGGIQDHINPNYPANYKITYPIENGLYVMKSGEYDGEETSKHDGLGVNNFYDDYGAKPGDSNYHPYNRYTSERVRRDWHDQDRNRNDKTTIIIEGGIKSTRFGTNPRNPQQGNQYRSRPVYGGVIGSCQVACTGMCYQTCDNECSESCSSTCFNRCGNACTSSCGNVCTGCSTLCYTSCKTKCENNNGYSCLKSGAKAVKISSSGGTDGEYVKNNLSYTTYTCQGCSYTCQFYPNKKTECWDNGCMGKCFTSCESSCSTSCFGGCVDNSRSDGDNYKTGKGRGCSGGCTLNCIGLCSGVCEGYCIQTCWHACKGTCSDNCSWDCSTECGSGCSQKCSQACTGCASCTGTCEGKTYSRGCTGCGTKGGCTSSCQHDCNKNCIGWGCRSVCGVDSSGACEANCRLNCSGTSCTSLCEDACSLQCTTCVNSCGFQCGPCVSECSSGCGSVCNITCTDNCENSCSLNCVHSCTEECGGCSSLCFSCVGMCIGVCSVKCQNGCSSCTNTCGWWCDSSCNRECFGNCSDLCINTCSGSCISFLTSDTKNTTGPSKLPTSNGYIYPKPKNRWEERESFRIYREPLPYEKPVPEIPVYDANIGFDENRILEVECPDGIEYVIRQTSISGGVYDIDHNTGEITINKDMLDGIVDVNKPNIDNGGGIFVIVFYHNEYIDFDPTNIGFNFPFGFEILPPVIDKDGNAIIIIQRDKFLFPEEEG